MATVFASRPTLHTRGADTNEPHAHEREPGSGHRSARKDLIGDSPLDAPRGARHNLRALMLALVALPGLLWAIVPTAAAATASDPVVFESRPAGSDIGGGEPINANYIAAHSFRLTQATHISALGAFIRAYNSDPVYAALYRIDTPRSGLDAVNDTDLLAVTLLTPGTSAADISGPVSITLQPGWYAIGIGTGRHGATASAIDATLANTGTATTTPSFGPYSVNTGNNALLLQGITTHLFVQGYSVPAPPANTDFLSRSAETWAYANSGVAVDSTDPLATRFHVDATTHVHRVSVWTEFGNGQLFAAIVRLTSSTAVPPPYGSAAFDSAVLGSALIDISSGPRDNAGDFGGLELTPGDYALIVGSGRFGASGSADVLTPSDGKIAPSVVEWASSFWFDFSGQCIDATLSGVLPQVQAAPNPVAFTPGAVGVNQQQTVTVHNTGAFPMQLGGLNVTGPDAVMFAASDTDACLTAVLAADAQCSFTLNYTPQTQASHNADLRVVGNGVPDPLVVPLSGSSVGLNVTLDDSTAYAAYGHTMHYLLTVTNTSASDQTNVAVSATLPMQLDASQTTWSCVSGCSNAGGGSLSDLIATLPPMAAVTYQIDAPVKSDATGDTVRLGASASSDDIGPFTGSDADTLVIFQNGFDDGGP